MASRIGCHRHQAVDSPVSGFESLLQRDDVRKYLASVGVDIIDDKTWIPEGGQEEFHSAVQTQFELIPPGESP